MRWASLVGRGKRKRKKENQVGPKRKRKKKEKGERIIFFSPKKRIFFSNKEKGIFEIKTFQFAQNLFWVLHSSSHTTMYI